MYNSALLQQINEASSLTNINNNTNDVILNVKTDLDDSYYNNIILKK